MKFINKIRDKYYIIGALIIIAVVMALIFNSFPSKQSIAQVMKSRVLGISDVKTSLPLAIRIIDNENEWRGVSDKTEISEIVKSLEVALYPEDLVSAFPDPNLKIGTTININRAPVIFLHDGLNNIETRSWAGDVSAYLAEKHVDLGPLDRLTPPIETKLNNRDTVTIVRIGERDELVEEVIAYQKIEKPTSDMYKGEHKLQQKGSDGKRVKTFRLRYENNALVSKILVNDEIIVPSQSEIVLIGTRPRITVRCRFNDIVEQACAQYGVDPNALCRTMMCESNGNPNSDGGDYKGLFQYTLGLWADLSPRAGFPGASIWDARSQIYVTAWAWAHGYRGRWPNC
jgi:uncharacterized protein YabE (DUF348 family)